ncbi:hypothetical protein EK0264_03690 [Epidermidibacterium keratini]|uniref:Uncharacterized protein n=1 Tax=Epidermidibacterium keratini TaxID=1891644 RepID=A0A7L4YKR8_9ACTN|nr:hypothetical protein [Epidermidibacterium keratini]QHB99472.1 hypothetical protein EK0264_03690 [Epidermidibacterium keratini]
MASPIPKDPSRRSRRNNPKAGFTSLPAKGRKGKAPAWPLPADTKRSALLELAEDRIAALVADIESAEDGRTKGRLRRNLAQAEQSAAILRLQIEQQTDLELGLWSALWATPQAKLWEASSAFVRMLAQFVRWNVKGEQGDLDAAKEARLQRKDFGLTPMDLLRARAEIEKVDEAEDRGSRRRAKPKPTATSAKDDPRGGLYAVR